MSLITASGRGFLLTDGVELKFSKSGTAWARLPLSFRNNKKTDTGWTHDKEILVEGTVFGPLAEALAESVTSRTDLHISGELYTEEYEGKTRIKMQVFSAWPVKSDRVPATAGAAKADSSAFPF